MEHRKIKRRSMFAEAMDRLVRNKTAMLGLIILLIIIVLCLLANVLAPEGYDYQDYTVRNTAPCKEFPFGTDELGRSLYARVLYGGRYSLLIGIVATSLAAGLGIIMGSIAGFYGGKVDNLIMRFLDVFSAIPNLLLAISLAATMGTGIGSCMIAVGVTAAPNFARIVRGPILAIKEQEFVEAARAIDASDGRIIFMHIVPNVLSPIIVQATMALAQSILMAASLSFLGLGVKAPMPEWGALVSAGRTYIRQYPYLCLYPGIAIMLTVLSLNLFGDGLRDALDPRLKK